MRRRVVEFLFLVMVALGAGPVGAAFWQWSTTPGSNATADPSINWSEGMAPSAVNDSARAMMAVLAAWRIDNGGSLISGGTSTNYTLTTSQPFSSVADMDGQSIAFIITPTNGANPTLNVNGIGGFPIVAANGSPVPAASMVDGHIYHVTFNSANSVFRVHDNFENVFNIPLGGLLWSTAPTAPNANFVAPSGQCISTTTYAAYWVQQGSPASGACPGGQFAIIDMRGMVAAGLDTLNGSPANVLTSSATGCGTAMTTIGAKCANGVQGFALTLAQLPTGITSNGSNSISVTSSIKYLGNTAGNTGSAQGGGTQITASDPGSGGVLNFVTSSASNSISVTSNNTSGAATPRVQPTIGLIPYLRIL